MGHLVITPSKQHDTIFVEDSESARMENSRIWAYQNTERTNIYLGRDDRAVSYGREDYSFGPTGKQDQFFTDEREMKVKECSWVSIRNRI